MTEETEKYKKIFYSKKIRLILNSIILCENAPAYKELDTWWKSNCHLGNLYPDDGKPIGYYKFAVDLCNKYYPEPNRNKYVRR